MSAAFHTTFDEHGVLERRFELRGQGEAVPGLVWTPSESSGPRPLVLIGHGGFRHKRYGYVLSLARRLVRHRGWAAAALDAPGHGERRPSSLQAGERTPPADVDQVVSEWQEAVGLLHQQPEIGPGPLGYWGLSMGCWLGVSFVAAEPRVSAAVLGLMHDRTERLKRDAPRIRCPVLFLVQWDDRSIARDGALALFDLIGSGDKRLHAHPGDHGDVPTEEMDQSESFFANHFAAPG